MGIGLYSSGQIHIDTQGYRTWGPDLTRNSSMYFNKNSFQLKGVFFIHFPINQNFLKRRFLHSMHKRLK